MGLAKSLPRIREFNTKPPTVWDWNLMAQKVNRLSDNEGVSSSIETTSTAASLDLTKFQFGMTYAGGLVTVNAGTVYHGIRAGAYIAETEVTITEDEQYVWVNYDFTTKTASIPSPSTAEPISDSTNFRVWLYKFRFNGSAITDYVIGHVGNIYIPGTFQ